MVKIVAYFPKIYPDEILFSVLGRYHTYSGNKFVLYTLEDLYSDTIPQKINIDLPRGIKGLLSHIPSNSGYRSDLIIQNNTLFNYYAPFISSIKQMELIDYMKCNEKNNINSFFRTTNKYSIIKKNLFYCPLCTQEDWEKYGEFYFHKLHQVPTVFVCQKHKCYLNEYPIPISIKNTMIIYKHDYEMVDKRPVYEQNDILLSELVQISNSAEYLLEKRNRKISSDSLYQKYLALLVKHDYINSRGYIDKKLLCNHIKNYYSTHILMKYNCVPDINNKDNWINIITQKSYKRLDPICHILLIQSLVEDFKDFCINYENINIIGEDILKNKEYKYRETLLNHIRQNTNDTRSDIRKKLRKEYDWIRLNDNEWFEENIVKSKKTIVKNELLEIAKIRLSEFLLNNPNCTRALICRNLKAEYFRCRSYDRKWFDDNLPKSSYDYSIIKKRKENYRQQVLSYISNNFGCNRAQIYEELPKQYQWLFLNDFEWFNETLPKERKVRNNIREELQNEYRENFLNFVMDHPECTRKEIYNVLKKEHAWFKRHDAKWYEMNSPQKKLGVPKKNYKWADIDTILLEELKKEYIKITCIDDYKKITKTYLIRNLESIMQNFVKKYLDYLPKSRDYIASVIETTEEYQSRKAINRKISKA